MCGRGSQPLEDPLEVVMASAQPKPDFERLWGREDSNLRRLSRRVYSPFPLAARAHPLERGAIVALALWRGSTRSSSAADRRDRRRRTCSPARGFACSLPTARAFRGTSPAAAG